MTTAIEAMPAIGSCDVPDCVARGVFDRLSSKWGPLILRQLLAGERRFSELRAAIGNVSEKMLAQTLRDLERDGFISRTSYPVIPPHVEYALTPLGRECADHIAPLLRFIEHHVRDFAQAQAAYDERPKRGRPSTSSG